MRGKIIYDDSAGFVTHVDVYPDKQAKPDVGAELNKPCIITFFTKKGVAMKKVKKLIEKSGVKAGTTILFQDYDPVTGKVVYEQEHFTRTGLDFDDDSSDDEDVEKAQEKKEAERRIAEKLDAQERLDKNLNAVNGMLEELTMTAEDSINAAILEAEQLKAENSKLLQIIAEKDKLISSLQSPEAPAPAPEKQAEKSNGAGLNFDDDSSDAEDVDEQPADEPKGAGVRAFA